LQVLNFNYAEYEGELEELGLMTEAELVQKLKRGEGARVSTSKFRGVSWERARRLWGADFNHNGKNTRLGQFGTEKGAARAYDHMIVWFRLHEVERKGGTELNFDYAEYEGELEELGRMTQIEVVEKLRRQALAQREAANNAEGHEAGEGAGWQRHRGRRAGWRRG
jgi:hypothetical protein